MYILHFLCCQTFVQPPPLSHPHPPPLGGEEQTKNKKIRGGRGDATTIFAKMLFYMVAKPIKTLYQYNIYYQLIA